MVAISKATLLSAVIALIGTSSTTNASPLFSFLDKRDGPTQTAPAGWKISWNKGARVSNGPSTNFISLSTIDASASTVTQNHVNTCVQKCATTSNCGFVNLVKETGSSLGNVVCLLFPHYIDSTKAIYTTGPQGSNGAVQYSYGIRSLCTPVNGGALTCTPQQVSGTSNSGNTGSGSSGSTSPQQPYQRATGGFPAAPSGATLIQWTPSACKTSLTVPAYANSNFLSGSNAQVAYISQHGSGSDFDNYFTYLYGVVGNNFPMVSPGFLTDDHSSAYYRSTNLAWASGIDSWAVGNDDTTGASCSSYDLYDSIINYYASSGKFPNLKTIVFVGHSGGGNMVSRFSTINNNNPKTVTYVVANAANHAYFTNARPNSVSNCGAAFSYPYQWTGSYPRYVAARTGAGAVGLFNQWKSRNVILLVGDQDTDTSGTQTCQSQAQGGGARRDRNYAYWAYQNILDATSNNVNAYYGYSTLKSQQNAISSGGFNHQECTVAGVAHDAAGIYQTSCGRNAIFNQNIGNGANAGASYP